MMLGFCCWAPAGVTIHVQQKSIAPNIRMALLAFLMVSSLVGPGESALLGRLRSDSASPQGEAASHG